MLWTATILIPKIQPEKYYDSIADDLKLLINGYDPNGYGGASVSIAPYDRTEYDEEDALNMVRQTQGDFLDGLRELQGKTKM
jgi:hypothetical protein